MISVISLGNINIPLFMLVFAIFLICSYLAIRMIETSKVKKKHTFNSFQNLIFIWILIWKITPVFANFTVFLSSPIPTLLYTPGGYIGIIAGMIGGIGYFVYTNLRKQFATYKIVLLIFLVAFVFLSDPIYINTTKEYNSTSNSFQTVMLTDLDGNQITIKESSKPIVLNFWASWCPPCKAEIPELELFYNKYKTHVDFYAVNMTSTETSVPDVKSFILDQGIQLPIVLDKTNSLAAIFQIKSLPTTIILKQQDNGIYASQRYTGPISVSILEATAF